MNHPDQIDMMDNLQLREALRNSNKQVDELFVIIRALNEDLETTGLKVFKMKETIYYWTTECEKLKAHSAQMMLVFQERDVEMQAAWKANRERELYFKSIINKVNAFTWQATECATPAPISYLNREL